MSIATVDNVASGALAAEARERESLQSRYELARAVAYHAGRRALAMFRHRDTLAVEHKGVQDVVSVADREIEQLIRARVRAAFPNDAFVGEESAADAHGVETARVVWVVDPIDGTSCFLNGMYAWCVSIGVMVDGQPVIGAVYDPNIDELFHAARGFGAWAGETRLAASGAQTLRDGVLGVGFSHRVGTDTFVPFLQRVLEDGGMFIRNGSGALMMAYVAAGRLIGYYEPHINAWDCLAGIVLVREAGGVVNDFLRDDGLRRGNPIVAAGTALYRPLAALIAATTRDIAPLMPMQAGSQAAIS